MIKVRDLNNGVRLVMEKIPHVKSVSLGIWVRAGAVNETPEISGISHFIEHMMFKGTQKRTARQIASDTDKIAGHSNAFTGKEGTCYYIKTLSDNIAEGVDILTDMFMNSLFSKDEMDRERQVIFEEMKMIEDSPEDDIHDIIFELAFKGNPLANSIIGTRETLFNVDTAAIKKYMETEYTTKRVVASVVGNFDEEELVSLFNERFEGLRTDERTTSFKYVDYSPSFRSKVKDIEQSHICIAIPTFKREDPDYYALSLFNNIFGGSMSSRLFQNIRETKGLAYSVYSTASSYTDDGYLNIYAGVSHDKIKDAVQGIKEELALVIDKGISEEEIEIAKSQMMGGYIYSMENTNSRMFNHGKNLVFYDKVKTQEDVINELKSVTCEDVNRIASRFCDYRRFSGAVLSNREIDIESYLKG